MRYAELQYATHIAAQGVLELLANVDVRCSPDGLRMQLCTCRIDSLALSRALQALGDVRKPPSEHRHCFQVAVVRLEQHGFHATE